MPGCSAPKGDETNDPNKPRTRNPPIEMLNFLFGGIQFAIGSVGSIRCSPFTRNCGKVAGKTSDHSKDSRLPGGWKFLRHVLPSPPLPRVIHRYRHTKGVQDPGTGTVCIQNLRKTQLKNGTGKEPERKVSLGTRRGRMGWKKATTNKIMPQLTSSTCKEKFSVG